MSSSKLTVARLRTARVARRSAMIALTAALAVVVPLAAPRAAGASATWTPLQAPVPSGAADGSTPQFTASACPGVGSCYLVGDETGDPLLPLVEVLSEGSWTPVEPPLPSGVVSGTLSSISCTSAASCVAVGYASDSDGTPTALVETLQSGVWTGSLPPSTPGASTDSDGYTDSKLASVSCAGTACQAVGFVYGEGPHGSYQEGMIASDAAGTWTTEAGPQPAGSGNPADGTELETMASVSCSSATACEAVGLVEDSGGYTWGLIEELSGSTWVASFAPEPTNTGTDDDGFQNAQLRSVDCEAGGTCVAAGYYITTAGGVYPDSMLVTTTPSSTTVTTAPMPSGSVGAVLTTISCASDGTCAAGGMAYIPTSSGDGDYALLEANTGSGGAWASTEAPVPSDAGTGANQDADMVSASCTTGGNCQVAGWYRDTATNAQMFRGLLESLSDGTWTGTETPQPSNAGTDANYDQYTQLSAISCASSTYCVASGRYATVNGEQGLIETYSSGTTPSPTISQVAPSSGPSSGGTKVTVTGTNLSGATEVTFGGTDATKVTAVSSTSVTATTPAHDAGVVTVEVTTPGGTSSPSSKAKFTFVAAPEATKLSPSKGATKGGTTVTVTGKNFTGVTKVEFGSTDGKDVHVDSTTKLTVKSPAHAKGRVNVRVVATGGTSKKGTHNRFTYG